MKNEFLERLGRDVMLNIYSYKFDFVFILIFFLCFFLNTCVVNRNLLNPKNTAQIN